MQLVQQVLGLERQRAGARRQRVQLRVHPAGRLERLCARRRARARRRPLSPPSSAPAPPAAAARSASTWRSRAALGLQLALLLLARRRAVDLRELPLEQVQLAVARAGALAQLLQPRGKRPLAAIGRAVGLAARRLLGPREPVQDLQLGRGQRELAVLVLAVEREQRGARVPQVGRRGAAAAQVRARPPLGAHPPRQHELLRVLGQPVPERRAHLVRQREHPLDVGLRGARAARSRTVACRRAADPARARAPSCPAPVSPVSTFNPGPRRSSARSISRRFSTRSSWSTLRGLPVGPTDRARIAPPQHISAQIRCSSVTMRSAASRRPKRSRRRW